MTLPASFLTRPLAHRALHDRAQGRVENSLGAVRAAVAAGYGIEIDVQGTADGQAVVFHDDGLDRLTLAQGPVRAHAAADLGRITLRDADEGIPTLVQVLAAVGGRVPLLIEVKDQSGDMGPAMGALPGAVAAALAGYAGPVAVMSFNPHAVAAMARLAPRVPRGLTTYAWPEGDGHSPADPARRAHLAAIADYDAVGACFISHHWRDLDRPRVADLAARGAAVLCWTIRSPDEEAMARRVAQNITFEGYAARLSP